MLPPPRSRLRVAAAGTGLSAGLRDFVGPYDGDDDDGGGSARRRNSPGFVGFDRARGDRDRARDYPRYDVVLDAPRPADVSARRLFDDVPYDDLPGDRPDPYDRGRNSDFIDTNGGSRRVRGSRGTIDIDARGGPPLLGGGGRSGLPQVYRRDYLDEDRPRDSLSAVERYFEAWNRRDVSAALACFADDVYYDDTQFSAPFDGKAALADHLLYVADGLPDSFFYVVDELSAGGAARPSRGRAASPTFQLGRSGVARAAAGYTGPPTRSVGVLWHLENELGPLPFARGCSFFKVDPRSNLIVEAYDFPEPAVVKTGSSGLNILSVANKLVTEPRRWFPFFAWIIYVYVVYFSNGILPGKDLLHADAKTWAEVRDLTNSFLLIAPAAHLPTMGKLNPVLEGLFNGVLAWAFLFSGFLSDERGGRGPYERKRERGDEDSSRYYERMLRNQEQVLDNGMVLVPPVSLTKRNLLGMVPTIVGMQLLTCGFLLPYLFSRTSERYSSERAPLGRPLAGGPRRIRPLYKEELDRPGLVLGEWRGLGVLLGAFGLFAVYWGFAGRPEAFGPPIWVSDKRMVEFMKLLNKDRVAAALVVDLWVLGIFQGWLVDDDWKRRGRSLEEEKFLRNVAKLVPFFGLASYFVFRPQYPSSQETFDYEGFFNAREEAARRGGGGRDEGFRDDGRFFGDRF